MDRNNIEGLTNAEKCRLVAEWLEPDRNLDGFAIYSSAGYRIRERDFDSREEAQQYIDRTDEGLNELHQSSANGVNIQPCVKSYPNFLRDEKANALAFDRLRHEGQKVATGNPFYELMRALELTTVDRKTAVVDAFIRFIEAEKRKK